MQKNMETQFQHYTIMKKYGYKDDIYDGQRKWYMDYMNRNIKAMENI